MTWNYRVIKHTTDDVIYYGIHEVYYDDKQEPSSYSEDSIAPYGQTLEEIKSDLEKMVTALSKPVLDVKIFHKD